MEGELLFEDLKELVEKLVETEDPSSAPESIDRLYSEVGNVEKMAFSATQRAQIEVLAVNLWNWAVSRRVGLLIPPEQKVKLCHISCKLIFLFDGNSPVEEAVQRQILMTMKTGKGWVDVGNAALADGFLQTAQKHLERLCAEFLENRCGSQDEDVHKIRLDRDLFKVLSYQAESAVAQRDFQRAVMCVQRCKDLLPRLPRVPGYLSILCYNFGVDAYYQKKFEECSHWLSQSYDIGNLNKNTPTGQDMQEHLHPAGLYLKIRILLRWEASDEELCEATMKLLDFKVPFDSFLSTAKLLLEHGRDSVGFDFLKTVCDRFESSADVGKGFLLHVKLLLQRKEDQLAKKKVEDILTAHHAGKELPPQILSWLHTILWDRAAQNFEAQNYFEALQWYNYSLNFYPSGQMDADFAKLQRNRASCYIHLKQLEKANAAVKEAERFDAANIFTQFIIFKIAVLRDNTEEALTAVDALEKSVGNSAAQEKEMVKEENSSTAFLTFAAQFALENGQQDVARRALEYLSQHSQDLQQVLTALKCLIRLTVPQISQTTECEGNRKEEISRIWSWLKTAHQRLAEPVAKENLTLDVWTNEAHWFRKIAWNLAMQCEKCPGTMRDFFLLSYELSQLCPSEKTVLTSQKACLLMVAAADLELGRSASEASQQTELLSRALEHIQGCKEISNVLKLAGDGSKDPTENLLLLYEIEARAKLHDAGLTSLLESVWELPQLETKILETIASVAMEHPAHYPDIAKKALRKALSLYLQGESIDVAKFSKCLHSFINLSLPDEALSTDVCSLQDIWSTFEVALRVISHSEEYPQVEILWLMTKAWNTGVSQYKEGMYATAEKWCHLGIRFLDHLGSLKKCYEGQMADLYGEVLTKVERDKSLPPNEE
ncbi:testis-expressed protein 11 isoform X2 [Monodelphis domestica]|uniref:testis-expressed protein 11 isoform X2 n=1 Tax=Monodelphis domestica TaxID=13616 RepID=UPI0024E1D81E|nr:testis-expressed protein 11 isoform X2 [Monodelphis domestica]